MKTRKTLAIKGDGTEEFCGDSTCGKCTKCLLKQALKSAETIRVRTLNMVQFGIDSMSKDWRAHGAMEKVYAADYIVRFLELLKKDESKNPTA